MICLKKSLKESILNRLNNVWTHVYLNKLEKNRNEVIFCTMNTKEQVFTDKLSNQNLFNDKNNNKNGNSILFLEEISNKLTQLKL